MGHGAISIKAYLRQGSRIDDLNPRLTGHIARVRELTQAAFSVKAYSRQSRIIEAQRGNSLRGDAQLAELGDNLRQKQTSGNSDNMLSSQTPHKSAVELNRYAVAFRTPIYSIRPC